MKPVTILLASTVLAGAALTSPVLAGDLHVFTSDEANFLTHSVWYDDGQEVTVIDAQFTTGAAEALLAEIAAETSSPVTRVIVTHPNADKFNGLSVLTAAGATAIASDATAAAMPAVDAGARAFWIDVAGAFTPETYGPFVPVTETYTGEETITLASGETITLVQLDQPGVSSDQTVVRIDATGDLIVGDLFAGNTHAWLAGGTSDGATIDAWKAGLAQLPSIGTGLVYGGRGDALPVEKAVAAQTAYLDRADAIVRGYVASLGDKASELADPATAQPHHATIQALMAEAFPSYAQPELVGFSVAGLVNRVLAAQG